MGIVSGTGGLKLKIEQREVTSTYLDVVSDFDR